MARRRRQPDAPDAVDDLPADVRPDDLYDPRFLLANPHMHHMDPDARLAHARDVAPGMTYTPDEVREMRARIRRNLDDLANGRTP